MEVRHGRGSTIVTSQLPVEHWHEAIGDPTLADAILDRVRHSFGPVAVTPSLHNTHRLTLVGDSMRKRQTKPKPLDPSGQA